MSYYFFMGPLQLPVTPGKLQIKMKDKNKTIDLINDGEVSILKTPGLAEVSFEALLPNVQYPFATYLEGFKRAEYFLNIFDQLKASLTPFQFIVCKMSPPRSDYDANLIVLTVALEDYEIVEDAGNGFDILVPIRLRQYRPYATKVLTVKTGKDGAKTASIEKQRQTSRKNPKVHKVVVGETLFGICKKDLGDGSRWQEIAKLNGITNPNSLQAGQVIKLA